MTALIAAGANPACRSAASICQFERHEAGDGNGEVELPNDRLQNGQAAGEPIHRHNIASGTTTIHARDRGQLGTFTLTDPLDAALVDDSRVYHGVTPVQAIEPGRPAYRDVLVVTFAGLRLREQGSRIRVQGAT